MVNKKGLFIMLFKTKELPEAALNWAVSKIVGDIELNKYASDWDQGGPIIEQEGIHLRPCYNNGQRNTGHDSWRADLDFKDGVMTLGKFTEYGETALIAAMRCYVTSNLGENVEIPVDIL